MQTARSRSGQRFCARYSALALLQPQFSAHNEHLTGAGRTRRPPWQIRSRIRVKLWVANFLLLSYSLRPLPPLPILRLAARREWQLPLVADDTSTITRLRSGVRALRELVGQRRTAYSPLLRGLFAELPPSGRFRRLTGALQAAPNPLFRLTTAPGCRGHEPRPSFPAAPGDVQGYY